MAIFSALAGEIGQGGANSNAATVQGATDQAMRQSQHQQAVNRSDASPWTAAGTSALSEIGKLLGWGELYNPGTDGSVYNYQGDPTGEKKKAAQAAFTTSPGYTFRLNEGVKAIDRSAASKGTTLSGGQIKGVQAFGEGLAADEYDNYFNRLTGLAGMGGQAQASTAGLNSGLSNAQGNYLMNGGIARGSAYERGANALASGISSGVNNTLSAGYLFRKPLGLG